MESAKSAIESLEMLVAALNCTQGRMVELGVNDERMIMKKRLETDDDVGISISPSFPTLVKKG
jgi:hypothetical protein